MHAVFIVSQAKHTWKEFKEVSEVSNTSPKAKMWSFLMMRDGHAFLCFASRCSIFPTHRFRRGLSRGSGCILALCLRFCFRASLSALSYSFSSHFSAILTSRLWDHKRRYSTGNDKLAWVYTTFANCRVVRRFLEVGLLRVKNMRLTV